MNPLTQQAQAMRQQAGSRALRTVAQEATQETAFNLEPTVGKHVVSGLDGASDGKSFMRRALNRIFHLLCRFLPGATTLRPFLHRMRGVRIGKNVWIGDDVYLENEFPDRVEIHDGAVVGLRSIIIAHTRGPGRIVIGKDVYIGAGCVIVTAARRPLVIGEGSVIIASSLVNSSIAPYTLYGSDNARPLAKLTKSFRATASYEEFIATIRPLSD
jgi:acetyltransferase-like isoleucine patch superfamily enzyme